MQCVGAMAKFRDTRMELGKEPIRKTGQMTYVLLLVFYLTWITVWGKLFDWADLDRA